ncbi:MAG TPA: 4Fe-4S binding protein, partial [Pelobium sp.]|nr:4Fe-4S binding protein [Pelobium sp.]
MGKYQLSEASFKASVTDPTHQALLMPNLKEMFGKTYNNNVDFIADYNKALDKTNQKFKEADDTDSVIYTDYALSITKNSTIGFVKENQILLFYICFIISALGGLIYMGADLFIQPVAGIKNNNIFKRSVTNRGVIAVLFSVFLIVFYLFLYKAPAYLSNWVFLVDPLSFSLTGGEASHWFLYGFLYSLIMLTMGIRVYVKYRHNNYQIIRNTSVIFFQLSFAFMIPNILTKLQLPSMDFKNMWPLDYSFFFDYRLDSLLAAGTLGYWMLGWGIFLFVVGVPVMVYFFGKRWYCSWVCGCGGLAETFGDPYRQLSDKSLKAWKYERVIVHSVLVFVIVMTIA